MLVSRGTGETSTVCIAHTTSGSYTTGLTSYFAGTHYRHRYIRRSVFDDYAVNGIDAILFVVQVTCTAAAFAYDQESDVGEPLPGPVRYCFPHLRS